jgi:hypothetical protein
MRKQIILLFLIISGIFAYKLFETKTPRVVFRAQTAQEEFAYCLKRIERLSWFKEQNYNFTLPQHKAFDELYSRPEKITKAEFSKLEPTFVSEVYRTDVFNKGLSVLKSTEKTASKALKKLLLLNQNWGFKLFPRYEIVLTLYGPGGSYNEKTGKVIIKTTPDGKFIRPNVANSIVHEMVHIGIEDNIVKKYNLEHWEKERIVDLICSVYLGNILSNYRTQRVRNKNIDQFINYENILKDLPSAIKSFTEKYPRIKE